MEPNWFPSLENPGDKNSHTPNQKRILSELRTLQELEQINPLDNGQSRQQILTIFDWKHSMLNGQEIVYIENILVELHDIFARHSFDIGMNEECTVKLTPIDDSPA